MHRRLFDLFIFSSVYIALCAVLMVHQTTHLLGLHYEHRTYYLFVFFSTLCSYNFHWYLTPGSTTEITRVRWTQQHKLLNLILSAIGLAGALWFFFQLSKYRLWVSGAALLTFLYTAPKMPLSFARQLRRIAVGKTIFLAFVWVYVTTLLPLIISGKPMHMPEILFGISRFFLIYPICILFDYRDRPNDKREGIRSMVTYLDESGIDMLFFISISVFVISTSALFATGFGLITTLVLLLPGLVVLCLYPFAKRNFSDYLYYFILDGLMVFSALITPFLSN